jgi:hypothetical protein
MDDSFWVMSVEHDNLPIQEVIAHGTGMDS